MAIDKNAPNPAMSWVQFSDQCAVVRRMISPEGEKGLLLQFTDRGKSEDVRRKALAFGFAQVADNKSLLLKMPGGKAWFTAEKLADAIGGEAVTLPREKVFSYPWTVDYSLPDLGKSLSSDQGPNLASIKLVGRNQLGEEVFEDASGRRFRKGRVDDAETRLWAETKHQDGTLFIRAKSKDDIPALAAGLMKSAELGTIRSDEFEQFVSAARKPFKGSPAIDAHLLADGLRDEMVRQIIGISVADEGLRQSYHRAVRIAENASSIVNAGPANEFFPSMSLLIFLRRLMRDVDQVDFFGNARLAAAVPLAQSGGVPKSQLYDLSDVETEAAAERAANILGRRASEGTTTILLSGYAAGEEAVRLRRSIGLAYALETVAEIKPHVACGRHDGSHVTIFVVGERRPTPAESLPVAAERTFIVSSGADLDGLFREILRSRLRIRDWHLDIAEAEAREAEEREDNERQRPYVALSKASRPFTMIPKALEGATAKALRRVGREHAETGGIDAAVSRALGVAVNILKTMLTSEQIDAIAMRNSAADRSRGFLLADQTGVGKGRSLAAMCRMRLRSGARVLYLTENAEINILDAWRDLSAVGARREACPVILASRAVALDVADSGNSLSSAVYKSESAASRKRIFTSGLWPDECNIVLTNYSQFNRGGDTPSQQWARTALDENTLLILDECHNALNPKSNTGKAVRAMIDAVGRHNVVFATATPLRNVAGAELYRPLLPDAEGGRLDEIFAGLASGGETAQESFTNMLAEDGVYIRRDHDLSNLEFQVRLPNDERMSRYQDVMNRFSPLVEQILDASLDVQALVGRAQAVRYREMINQGYEVQAARAETNALYQYSGASGGPLARLARLTINALKVDQVVEETLNEIREGRKPMISFHSTGAALFSELATNGAGDSMDSPVTLTLADQISRVAESIYKVTINDEVQDARNLDNRIAESSARIAELIAGLPPELPVSPVDALIEGLMRNGVSAGELSGRNLSYRNGRIVRREDTNRRSTVDSFNNGELDVLIYNAAGATGGSYHASPEFRDQRPRSLVEMETPVDIIKYVQSQGRGNRYGQVARPRVVSVMTGLIPEMRILQQRNRKLRSMGASIDGNRSHPLLLDDVPDFLNVVGDQAAAQVLMASPDLARRLGFQELAGSFGDERGEWSLDGGAFKDSGAASKLIESIANRVLTRSLVLSATAQLELVELIRYEFDAIIEELESRNLNPLRPKELAGEIEILGTTLFSGLESEPDDAEVSSFFAPLYMSTGIHHFSEDPIGSDELVRLVDQSRISDGADGFARYADRVESMLPTLLRTHAHPNSPIEEAMADPENQPYRFRMKLKRLKRLVHLLRNIKPGRAIQFDAIEGLRSNLTRTVVKASAPDAKHADLPQAYKIRTVAPGDSKPEIVSLRRLVQLPSESVRFAVGLEQGPNDRHLRAFVEQSSLERRYPVQVLSGNHLAAIAEARRNSLGTMSLYKETSGQMQRGIVVDRHKTDLRFLPVVIPSARAAAAFAALVFRGRIEKSPMIWTGKRDAPSISCRLIGQPKPHRSARLDLLQAPRRSDLQKSLGSRPGLKDLLFTHSGRRRRGLLWPLDANDIYRMLKDLDGLPLMTDGMFRESVNEINAALERGEMAGFDELLALQWVQTDYLSA